VSCGSDFPDSPADPSAPGTLIIAVTTTGSFLDPDGYEFSIDGIGSDPPWTVVGTASWKYLASPLVTTRYSSLV
jgi:hypothetical protein